MKTLMLVAIVLGVLLLSISINILVTKYAIKKIESKQEKSVFQGPVKPTDNESYFRSTGKTKHLEDK